MALPVPVGHVDHEAKVRTPVVLAMESKVRIDYTNYRGERAERIIVPQALWHGSTTYHPNAQWLLTAWDCDKKQQRTFALRDVHSWQPEP